MRYNNFFLITILLWTKKFFLLTLPGWNIFMPYVVFVLFLSFIIGLLIIESLLLLEILIFIIFKFINLLLLLSILLLFEIQSSPIFLQLLVSLFSSSWLWNVLVDIRLSVLDVVVLLLNIKLFLKEKDEGLSPFVLLLFLILPLLWSNFFSILN